MALFIAVEKSGYNFDVVQAQIDILSLSGQDSNIWFDESNVQTFDGYITFPVIYLSQYSTGVTPDRLYALVNHPAYPASPNVILLAVPEGDFLVGNKRIKKYHGRSLKAGGVGNPFSNHIYAAYDTSLCDGHGYWVREDGTVTGKIQETTETLLYHELSHCYHFLMGTTAATNPQEEKNARNDENDMRDALGLPRRKVSSGRKGCGGGIINTCCIIASLSTGSPYSSEVNRFRHFREYALRSGEVGDDFFKHFHYHYYGFSPEVCRLMGHQPALSPLIREYFVVPLLAGVELLIHYAEHGGQGLVDLLRQQAAREDFAGTYRQDFLNELSVCLSLVSNYDQATISTALLSKGEEFAGIVDLLRYVNEQTIKDEFINWALVDVLRIWLSGALLLTTEKTEAEINAEIYAAISEWISRLPITPVWEEFSRLQTENELSHLEQFIFDRQSKEVFAERLIEEHPKYSTTIRGWAEH